MNFANEEVATEGPPSALPDDLMQAMPEDPLNDPEQIVDSDDEEPPDIANFEPTAEQKRDLKLAHDNAGHPTNQDFARLLRRGNAKPEVADWVRKHFQCEACEANKPPRAKRPAAVPRSYRFNLSLIHI